MFKKLFCLVVAVSFASTSVSFPTDKLSPATSFSLQVRARAFLVSMQAQYVNDFPAYRELLALGATPDLKDEHLDAIGEKLGAAAAQEIVEIRARYAEARSKIGALATPLKISAFSEKVRDFILDATRNLKAVQEEEDGAVNFHLILIRLLEADCVLALSLDAIKQLRRLSAQKTKNGDILIELKIVTASTLKLYREVSDIYQNVFYNPQQLRLMMRQALILANETVPYEGKIDQKVRLRTAVEETRALIKEVRQAAPATKLLEQCQRMEDCCAKLSSPFPPEEEKKRIWEEFGGELENWVLQINAEEQSSKKIDDQKNRLTDTIQPINKQYALLFLRFYFSLLELNLPQEALSLLSKAAPVDNFDPSLIRSNALKLLGRYEEALKIIEADLKEGKNVQNNELQRAFIFFEKGKEALAQGKTEEGNASLETAKNYFLSGVGKYDKGDDFLRRVHGGECLYRQGGKENWRRAEALLEETDREFPTTGNPALYATLAHLYFHDGKTDLAFAVLHRAKGIFLMHVDFHIKLFEIFAMQGWEEEAFDSWLTAMILSGGDPQYASAVFRLPRSYFGESRRAIRVRLLEKILGSELWRKIEGALTYQIDFQKHPEYLVYPDDARELLSAVAHSASANAVARERAKILLDQLPSVAVPAAPQPVAAAAAPETATETPAAEAPRHWINATLALTPEGALDALLSEAKQGRPKKEKSQPAEIEADLKKECGQETLEAGHQRLRTFALMMKLHTAAGRHAEIGEKLNERVVLYADKIVNEVGFPEGEEAKKIDKAPHALFWSVLSLSGFYLVDSLNEAGETAEAIRTAYKVAALLEKVPEPGTKTTRDFVAQMKARTDYITLLVWLCEQLQAPDEKREVLQKGIQALEALRPRMEQIERWQQEGNAEALPLIEQSQLPRHFLSLQMKLHALESELCAEPEKKAALAQEAQREAREVIGMAAPKSLAAACMAAHAASFLNDPGQAVQILVDYLNLPKEREFASFDLYKQLADNLVKLEKKPAALALYGFCFELQPENPDTVQEIFALLSTQTQDPRTGKIVQKLFQAARTPKTTRYLLQGLFSWAETDGPFLQNFLLEKLTTGKMETGFETAMETALREWNGNLLALRERLAGLPLPLPDKKAKGRIPNEERERLKKRDAWVAIVNKRINEELKKRMAWLREAFPGLPEEKLGKIFVAIPAAARHSIPREECLTLARDEFSRRVEADYPYLPATQQKELAAAVLRGEKPYAALAEAETFRFTKLWPNLNGRIEAILMEAKTVKPRSVVNDDGMEMDEDGKIRMEKRRLSEAEVADRLTRESANQYLKFYLPAFASPEWKEFFDESAVRAAAEQAKSFLVMCNWDQSLLEEKITYQKIRRTFLAQLVHLLFAEKFPFLGAELLEERGICNALGIADGNEPKLEGAVARIQNQAVGAFRKLYPFYAGGLSDEEILAGLLRPGMETAEIQEYFSDKVREKTGRDVLYFPPLRVDALGFYFSVEKTGEKRGGRFYFPWMKEVGFMEGIAPVTAAEARAEIALNEEALCRALQKLGAGRELPLFCVSPAIESVELLEFSERWQLFKKGGGRQIADKLPRELKLAVLDARQHGTEVTARVCLDGPDMAAAQKKVLRQHFWLHLIPGKDGKEGILAVKLDEQDSFHSAFHDEPEKILYQLLGIPLFQKSGDSHVPTRLGLLREARLNGAEKLFLRKYPLVTRGIVFETKGKYFEIPVQRSPEKISRLETVPFTGPHGSLQDVSLLLNAAAPTPAVTQNAGADSSI